MIRFNKLRVPTILLSLAVIVLGLWFLLGTILIPGKSDQLLMPKGFNYGIDFQGGLVHQVTIYSGIDIDEVRDFALKSGLGNEVQQVLIKKEKRIGDSKSFLIKTILTAEDNKKIETDPDLTPAKYLSQQIETFHGMIYEKYGTEYIIKGDELAVANKYYPDRMTGELTDKRTDEQRIVKNVVKESENVISPAYSKGLRTQSLMLILFVLVIMLLYISLRFKFKYAVGAVFALIHDVLIVCGIISFIQLEFDYTIIAALLFIIGYSLNDTIVIFDRIRENYAVMRESTAIDVINTSINQSLSRTVITSLTTLLAVLALFIWGGQKVYGFSLTIILGIISGTYSSIFIASPVVDSWERIFATKKERIKELKKAEKKQEKELSSSEEKPGKEKSVNSSQISLSKKQLKKISGQKK